MSSAGRLLLNRTEHLKGRASKLGQQKQKPQLDMLVNKLKLFTESSPAQGPLSERQPDRHIIFTPEQELVMRSSYTPQEKALKADEQLRASYQLESNSRFEKQSITKKKVGRPKKSTAGDKVGLQDQSSEVNQSYMTKQSTRRAARMRQSINLDSSESKAGLGQIRGLLSPMLQSDATKAEGLAMKKYRSSRNLNLEKSSNQKPKAPGIGYLQNSLQNTGLYYELSSKIKANIEGGMQNSCRQVESCELSGSLNDPIKSLRSTWMPPNRLNQTMDMMAGGQQKCFDRANTSQSRDESNLLSFHESYSESSHQAELNSVPLKDKKSKVFTEFFSGINEAQKREGYLVGLQKTNSHHSPQKKVKKAVESITRIHDEYGLNTKTQERKTLASVFGLEESNDSYISKTSYQGVDDPMSRKISNARVKTKAGDQRPPPVIQSYESIPEINSGFKILTSVARESSPKKTTGKSRMTKKSKNQLQSQISEVARVVLANDNENQSSNDPFKSNSSRRESIQHSLKGSKNTNERGSFKKSKPASNKFFSATNLGSFPIASEKYQIRRLSKLTREKFSDVNQNNSAFIKPDNDSTMMIGIDSQDVNKSVEIYDRLLDMPTCKKTAMKLPDDSQACSKDTIDHSGSCAWVFEDSPKGDFPEKEEATAELEKQLKLNPLSKNLLAKIKTFFSQKDAKLESEYPTSISHYELLKCIGKGAFGKVHLGTQALTGRKVALKTIGKKYLAIDADNKKKTENEISLLMKASKCKHVVRLLEVFESKDYYFLVTEYAAGGDLKSIIKSRGGIPEEEAKPIFVDVIKGLKELHGMNIIHRDLKPENVVLTEKNKACIADLGISKEVVAGELLKDTCGTPIYEAPECLNLDKGYDGYGADIWTLGILLYEMIYEKPPFKSDKVEDLYSKIASSELTFPPSPEVSSSLKDLLRRILQKDPVRRLNLDEARSHLWLDNYHEADRSERDATARLGNERFTAYYIQNIGFPKKYVTDSLRQGVFNHATACYYAMLRSKNKT